MVGIGTIVNFVLVILGSIIGLALKKVLPKRITDSIMQALGLAVLVVGLSGMLSASFVVTENKVSAEYILLMIVSLAVGTLIGELIRIEDRLNSFVARFDNKFSSGNGTFTQGFVTATLVFCVGSMAILGAIEDGINQNPDILFAKSALDAVSSVIFASTLGVGVAFSAISIAIYQGLITALSIFIEPYLKAQVIDQMSVVGSVLILGTGLNMLGVTKIKVGNLLPAILIPIIYYLALSICK